MQTLATANVEGGNLGGIVSRHAYSSTQIGGRLLLAVLLIAMPLYPIVMWLSHGLSVARLVLCLLPGVFLALGVMRLRDAIRRARFSIELHQRGLAVVSAASRREYPWESVSRVTEIQTRSNGVNMGRTGIEVAFADGSTQRLDVFLGDFDPLAAAILARGRV